MDLKRKIDKYAGSFLTCFVFSLFFWKKFGKIFDRRKIKSILVIKLTGLGDFAILLSSVYELKKTLQPEKLTLLSLANNGFDSINNGLFDKTILMRKENIFTELVSVLRTIQKENFDLIIDFTFSPFITAFLTFFSNAHCSIGYKTMGIRRFLYNYTLPVLPDKHISEAYYEAVRFCLNDPERKVKVRPIHVPNDEKFIKSYFKTSAIAENEVLIGIHPCSLTSGTYERHGIGERYGLLAKTLIAEFNAKIFFTGTPQEGLYLQKILKEVDNKNIIFCFNLSLPQLYSLILRCNLFISIDSGPMHIASLLGVPTIGIFGPDTPVRYAPLASHSRYLYNEMDCSPCVITYKAQWNPCDSRKCMELISIEAIVNEAKTLISKQHKAPHQLYNI